MNINNNNIPNQKGILIEYDSGFISSELTCQDGVC